MFSLSVCSPLWPFCYSLRIARVAFFLLAQTCQEGSWPSTEGLSCCSYFQLFRIWNEAVGLIEPELYFSHGYCKMGNYMDVSSRDFSNWLIAAITAERIIVLAFPFQVSCVTLICKYTPLDYDFRIFMFLAENHFILFCRTLHIEINATYILKCQTVLTFA